MPLNNTETTALRAACLADPGAAAFFAGSGNAQGLKAYLNAQSSATAWRTNASVSVIMDAIDFSKYTPTATVSGTDVEPMLSRKLGWVLETQIKQMNLQVMLQGRETINAARPNVRGGLRDAVIQLPTGALDANGKPTLASAGSTSVLNACTRLATRAELMLAAPSSPSDQTGPVTARVLTWEGEVDDQDASRLLYRDDGSVWTA